MDSEERLDERLRAAAMSSAPSELRRQVLQQRRWQRAMAAMQPAPAALRAGVLARGHQAAAARRAPHHADDLPGWMRWLFGAPLRWAPALLVPLCLGLGLGAGLAALDGERQAQASLQAADPGPQASVDELLADFWGTPLDDYALQLEEEGAAL